MRIKVLIISILSLLVLAACDSKKRVKAPEKGDGQSSHSTITTGHTVLVQEVVMAPSYMYLRVTEDGKEYWIATNNQPVEVGMTLHFEEGMEMKDFPSKELERTFESLWFVQKLRAPVGSQPKREGTVSPHGGSAIDASSNVSVEKMDGGVTIAELFASPASFEGKNISIRAKVTKFNANIMGRNWVHLQDGSSHDNKFDLTLTTTDNVEVGDVVIFNGTVALNKDFGAGYVYDLIIEAGVLAKES